MDTVELSTILREDARFFTFTVKKEDAGPIHRLKLPEEARVVFFYRGDRFFFAEAETELRVGDEAIMLTHSRNIRELEQRWHVKELEKDDN